MTSTKKIYVGLSGGVDSAVAALLLKKAGHRLVGIFMRNWSDCDWLTEERWAKRVAAHLDIHFETWDFEKEYREHVLTNFYDEYRKGRTPNPDILCNKFIKFDLFLKQAVKRGADGIATGHYASIQNGKLLRGTDTNKDQSYFLYTLTKEQLPLIHFPIGLYDKSQVRTIAEQNGLPNFNKKDSQGICFVGSINLKTFLEKVLPKNRGSILNDSGEKIGEHDGIHFYTEGQREGLYLGGLKEPHYVAHRDRTDNTLIATTKEHPMLYSTKAVIKELHSVSQKPFPEGMTAKIRYRGQDQEVSVVQDRMGWVVTFKQPQFAMSEGQSIVFYNEAELLGGGIIEQVLREEGLVESIKIKQTISHEVSRD